MSSKQQLLEKLRQRQATAGVIGLGYVGLPLAVAFAKAGLRVIGLDTSAERVGQLMRGQNYIPDIADATLRECIASQRLQATTDAARLAECDAICIAVPTPLDRFKKPDTTYIEASCTAIGRHMRPGTLVCLESTTYPTTTEDLVIPILERESGLRVNDGFWACFSPERIDPGNRRYTIENTPKVIGGFGADASELACALYETAIEKLHVVASPREAEMVKILENTYRLVNIALINELALLSGKMGISIWNVIEAAKTKPYGFQAFYPGPGIGGHCIPLDPFYLEFIAKQYGFDLTMINTAGHIENLMAHRMTIKINSALNSHRKPINGSRLLFIGAAYKPDINDARESPALRIMEEVHRKGGVVSYHDPFVSEVELESGAVLANTPLSREGIAASDCVVVTTKHTPVDYALIAEHAALIVDLCNAYAPGGNVFKF
jgi:UDP-N-acetyl-D-glucosamine dehydrogenase